MAAVSRGAQATPSAGMNLTPLYSGGLWLAVI